MLKVPVEETENDLDTMLDEELDAIEAEQEKPFINCEDFKLLELEAKGDRRYRFNFMADSMKSSLPYDLVADGSELEEFENLFSQLGKKIYPILFPGVEQPALRKFKQRFVQSKNKEPQVKVTFTVDSPTGVQFVCVNKDLNINSLAGDIQDTIKRLEDEIYEQVTKKPGGPDQLEIPGINEENE